MKNHKVIHQCGWCGEPTIHECPETEQPSKTNNSETLADFVAYCTEHPNERFWQALRNWIPKETGYHFIFVSTLPQYEYEPSGRGLVDTFNWEGKNE